MIKSLSSPDIFDFLDVVLFLQEYYKYKKSINKNFSYSSWCQELNIGSNTILRFILQRKRRITLKTAEILKINLKLNNSECEYFNYLLSYSQSNTEAERTASGSKLIAIQCSRYKQNIINPELASSDALMPVILTLLSFTDFKATNESIAEALDISIDNIQIVMQQLLINNLVRIDNEMYFSKVNSFKIADQPYLMSLRKFHEFWLEKSKAAFDLDFKERRFRALKFSLSEDEFNLAIEKINKFSIELLSQFNHSTIEGRRLYMLENVLFPVTKR